MNAPTPASTEESLMTDQPWIKARRSAHNGACLEVRLTADGGADVRDSKDPAGPVLRFTPAEWDAFLDGAKNGEFG